MFLLLLWRSMFEEVLALPFFCHSEPAFLSSRVLTGGLTWSDLHFVKIYLTSALRINWRDGTGSKGLVKRT